MILMNLGSFSYIPHLQAHLSLSLSLQLVLVSARGVRFILHLAATGDLVLSQAVLRVGSGEVRAAGAIFVSTDLSQRSENCFRRSKIVTLYSCVVL